MAIGVGFDGGLELEYLHVEQQELFYSIVVCSVFRISRFDAFVPFSCFVFHHTPQRLSLIHI